MVTQAILLGAANLLKGPRSHWLLHRDHHTLYTEEGGGSGGGKQKGGGGGERVETQDKDRQSIELFRELGLK